MKLLLGILTLSLLSPVGAQAELKVASLSTITTDIAKNVGGDKIELFPLVKAGVDPHEFQPTPSDVKKIANANLVLFTGKHIEGYLTKLEQTVGDKVQFIDTGATIKALPMAEEEHDGHAHGHSHGGEDDPHWWHSIKNVKKATAVVRDAFVKADPTNKAVYEKNASDYLAKLDELLAWATEKVAELPREKRKLVTSHDAFQYLAKDYGFTVHPVQGISHADEPSSKKVAELIVLIKKQGVKAVFAENIENPKVLTEITKETGAKLGGELYADGLGDKEAATYPDMVRYNLTTIVEGLK
jgi:zinc/manganese transport system substrate-binding protein